MNNVCSDSTDIYCLLNNYYLPISECKDTPVLLYEFQGPFIYFEGFNKLVLPFLKDSLQFSDYELTQMLDTSSLLNEEQKWDFSRLKRIVTFTKKQKEQYHNTLDASWDGAIKYHHDSLGDCGFYTLSRPMINNKRKVVVFAESSSYPTDVHSARIILIYNISSTWNIKVYNEW